MAVSMPSIDVVKESLKIENDSLKAFSVSVLAVLVLVLLTRGKHEYTN